MCVCVYVCIYIYIHTYTVFDNLSVTYTKISAPDGLFREYTDKFFGSQSLRKGFNWNENSAWTHLSNL